MHGNQHPLEQDKPPITSPSLQTRKHLALTGRNLQSNTGSPPANWHSMLCNGFVAALLTCKTWLRSSKTPPAACCPLLGLGLYGGSANASTHSKECRDRYRVGCAEDTSARRSWIARPHFGSSTQLFTSRRNGLKTCVQRTEARSQRAQSCASSPGRRGTNGRFWKTGSCPGGPKWPAAFALHHTAVQFPAALRVPWAVHWGLRHARKPGTAVVQ